jgi:hypothetical protein
MTTVTVKYTELEYNRIWRLRDAWLRYSVLRGSVIVYLDGYIGTLRTNGLRKRHRSLSLYVKFKDYHCHLSLSELWLLLFQRGVSLVRHPERSWADLACQHEADGHRKVVLPLLKKTGDRRFISEKWARSIELVRVFAEMCRLSCGSCGFGCYRRSVIIWPKWVKEPRTNETKPEHCPSKPKESTMLKIRAIETHAHILGIVNWAGLDTD